MKILLIVPTFNYKSYPSALSISDFPAGLAYIAAALKKAGHKVVGLNLNNHFNYESASVMVEDLVEKALRKDKFDLIGIGGICVDYACIKKAMEVVTQCCKTSIVLGGGIMRDADWVFNKLKPNFAIVGEAEKAIVQLANKEPLDTIDNLYYWKDGKATFTRKNYDYGDINDLPFPDYEVFGGREMVDKYAMKTRVMYRYPRYNPKTFIITTGRSCPFSCTFCIHGDGPKYRVRSLANIMAEIKENYDRYHFNILIIIDELFAITKIRAQEFCAVLNGNKRQFGWDFVWAFQTHASAGFDLETLKMMKDAGCYWFSYGIENINPDILKSMNKHITKQQIVEAIGLAKEAGLAFGGNILFGDTAETLETIQENINFVVDHCQDSFVFLTMIQAYPGCKLFDKSLQAGKIPPREIFYENLGEHMYNLSNIKNEDMAHLARLTGASSQYIQSGLTKTAHGELELDKNLKSPFAEMKYYTIKYVCPHCDKDVVFTDLIESERRIQAIVGCPYCGRKINVKLMKNMAKLNMSGYEFRQGDL